MYALVTGINECDDRPQGVILRIHLVKATRHEFSADRNVQPKTINATPRIANILNY